MRGVGKARRGEEEGEKKRKWKRNGMAFGWCRSLSTFHKKQRVPSFFHTQRLTRFFFFFPSELAREKMWSRIHLIPMLQAEEDRDLVRRTWADKARERELLGSETRVYHSDRCVVGRMCLFFFFWWGEGGWIVGELDAVGSQLI